MRPVGARAERREGRRRVWAAVVALILLFGILAAVTPGGAGPGVGPGTGTGTGTGTTTGTVADAAATTGTDAVTVTHADTDTGTSTGPGPAGRYWPEGVPRIRLPVRVRDEAGAPVAGAIVRVVFGGDVDM